MNERDDQKDLGALAPMERVLERFQPVGPPAGLRARVLDAAVAATLRRSRGRAAVAIWRSAVAAGLVAALWLNLAANQISGRLAGQVGLGPAVWTQQAEEAAQLLDGDGWGRQYVAMALLAGPLGRSPTMSPGAIEEGLALPTQ